MSEIYQLLVELYPLFKAGDETKLLFSLYDNTLEEFITEQYCLHTSSKSFPKVGSTDDMKFLLKDIPADILTHDINIICYVYRFGNMEQPDVLNHKKRIKRRRYKKPILRPFGCAVLKIKDHIQTLLHDLGTRIGIEPKEAAIYCPKQEKYFNQLPIDIINHINFDINGNNDDTKAWYAPPLSIGIAHSYVLYTNMDMLQKQYPGDLGQLTFVNTLKEYQNQNINKRLQLYVKILDAHVLQRNRKIPCNVAVHMSLRHNISYATKPKCIQFGTSPMAEVTDIAKTVVFYHDNDPILNQLFTVLIPDHCYKALEEYHLYLGCFHIRKNKKKAQERGFGFIKLSDIVTLYFESKLCNVPLYRLEKGTCNRYLEAKLKGKLKSENKFINIEIRYISTMQKYLMIISGYARCCVIPPELISILLMFLL